MFFTKMLWMSGSMLFCTASAVAGKVFLGSGSSQQQDVVLVETVGQIIARMEKFKASLNDGDVVTVADFPMPGETMVWLTPKDGGHWNNSFDSWNLIDRPYVKVKSVNDLKRWCQIQKEITKVHINKTSTEVKLRMSLDSKVTHSQLVQASDLNDVKYYCARPITNKEWYGKAFRTSSEIKVTSIKLTHNEGTCAYWAKLPYSKVNENKLEPCLRKGIEIDEIVDYGDE